VSLVRLFPLSPNLVLTVLPADGSDWISVSYIVEQTRQSNAASDSTSAAVDSIVRGADRLLASGPWGVFNLRRHEGQLN